MLSKWRSNPAGIGVYAFVDLFHYALEGEADFAGGSYDFTFDNPISSIGPVNFVWGRASYSVTLKKNLMDVSIPFLAEAALNCWSWVWESSFNTAGKC